MGLFFRQDEGRNGFVFPRGRGLEWVCFCDDGFDGMGLFQDGCERVDQTVTDGVTGFGLGNGFVLCGHGAGVEMGWFCDGGA